MGLAGFFYAFLGFYFLYRTLLRNFSRGISFWVLLSIFLGTNLFHYVTKEMAIAHSYSFFLFALLLFHIPKYLSKPSFVHSLILGLLLGAIVLMRPTNILCCFMLIGYDVYTWPQLKNRLLFFLKKYWSVLCVLLFAFMVWIPQLWYWKEMTGHWFYYSYKGEEFIYWKHPKILEVWFDTQNGLFLYSPLVLLMILGIGYGIRRQQHHGPVLLLIFLVATYLFASWWTWYFGGAFGHRCYVEYYAFLAIPLAGLFDKIYQRSQAISHKIVFSILLVAMMIYSVRLSYLNSILPGPWDGPEWRWSWEKYAWVMKHFF